LKFLKGNLHYFIQIQFYYIRPEKLKTEMVLKNILSKIFSFPLIFIFYLLLSLFYSCEEQKTEINEEVKKKFISLEGKQFNYQNNDFFPVMVNYVVDFIQTENGPAISPTIGYENPDDYEFRNKEGLKKQMDAHFALLKQKGFNCIRLCLDRVSTNAEGTYFAVSQGKELFIDNDKDAIFAALDEVINVARDNELFIMLLIRAPYNNKALEQYSQALLQKYKEEPIIFSYDFFNEPLYFDKERLEKKDAVKIVEKWRKWMDKYAPYQLLTIGVSEPIEVSRWDVSVMPIDFVSFHTYHPLRVPNEIFWYSKYINKPWIIGETSLPADNDSISYEEQRQFMTEVFKQTKLCGGSGFGWWEFQDEPYLPGYEWAFNGLLDNNGETKVEGKDYIIQGTIKPAMNEINELLNKTYEGVCTCAVNYHNMVGYKNFVLKGQVIDEKSNKPIEGATIRGWNDSWAIGMNTFSNKNGNFTLYSNDPCVHFEISAPGMNLLKFTKTFEYQPLKQNAIPINALTGRDIEYQSIAYYPFLKSQEIPEKIKEEHFIFNFNPELFLKAEYEAEIGTVKLKKFRK
jgi:hypothetical protein